MTVKDSLHLRPSKRAAILVYNLEYIDRRHCTLIDLALPMDDENGKMFAIGYAWQRR